MNGTVEFALASKGRLRDLVEDRIVNLGIAGNGLAEVPEGDFFLFGSQFSLGGSGRRTSCRASSGRLGNGRLGNGRLGNDRLGSGANGNDDRRWITTNAQWSAGSRNSAELREKI